MMFQSSAEAQAGFGGEGASEQPIPCSTGVYKKKMRNSNFLKLIYVILRLPTYDWLTFGTVDDIYDADALGLMSLRDKGNGQKFWHEKSSFDDDGIYRFLIDDVTQ